MSKQYRSQHCTWCSILLVSGEIDACADQRHNLLDLKKEQHDQNQELPSLFCLFFWPEPHGKHKYCTLHTCREQVSPQQTYGGEKSNLSMVDCCLRTFITTPQIHIQYNPTCCSRIKVEGKRSLRRLWQESQIPRLSCSTHAPLKNAYED